MRLVFVSKGDKRTAIKLQGYCMHIIIAVHGQVFFCSGRQAGRQVCGCCVTSEANSRLSHASIYLI